MAWSWKAFGIISLMEKSACSTADDAVKHDTVNKTVERAAAGYKQGSLSLNVLLNVMQTNKNSCLFQQSKD